MKVKYVTTVPFSHQVSPVWCFIS